MKEKGESGLDVSRKSAACGLAALPRAGLHWGWRVGVAGPRVTGAGERSGDSGLCTAWLGASEESQVSSPAALV